MRSHCVAPLVGAWIEIISIISAEYPITVAPLVGAWIEILAVASCTARPGSRSSCRSVD